MSDRFTITVGERAFVCTEGRVTTELNQPDRASGTVAANDLVERGADWRRTGPGLYRGRRRDAWGVMQAQPREDGSVALSLRGGTIVDESLLPPMVVQQIDRREIVYLAARETGFDTKDINIHGLAEAVAFEPLWVLAPVRGLSVRREVKVGVVELVDGDAGREMLRRFVPPLDAQFSDPLADVGAFARVAVPAKHLYDAEREGLGLSDDATAWLTARLRYSWSHGPDQRLEPYERATTLVVVERLPGVAVFPVEGSGRRWWRDTTFAQRERFVELAPDARWLTPPMPTQVRASDRQALVALRRAVAARDPVQRVVALWEAIEFYVGDRSPEAQFADAEVKGAIERAREGLIGATAERVGNLLRNLLNSWPLLARFEEVLHAEGVPYTDEDRTRIKSLRTSRSRAVHGAQADPSHDEIDQALGLMSRALSTRWRRRAET